MEKTETERYTTLNEFSIETKDDKKPQVNKSHWRLYGHPLCPYVERVKMALDSKCLKYQNVHVSLPHRPSWFYEYHTGAVPVLEFPDGTAISESLILMEMIEDYCQRNSIGKDSRLYPEDPIVRAQRKLFLDRFKDLGLLLFRGTLSQNPEKKERDFKQISKLLEFLESTLSKSKTNYINYFKNITLLKIYRLYLFSEETYTFVDIALVVLVQRLFFFKYSDLGQDSNYNILDNLSHIERWIKAIRSRPELQKAITNAEEYNIMLKDFLKTRVWGLKYPLAKI